MTEPSLPELEARRDWLYAQLSAVGDFRRGSVSENYRKCGKLNCACAQPDHPGHADLADPHHRRRRDRMDASPSNQGRPRMVGDERRYTAVRGPCRPACRL